MPWSESAGDTSESTPPAEDDMEWLPLLACAATPTCIRDLVAASVSLHECEDSDLVIVSAARRVRSHHGLLPSEWRTSAEADALVLGGAAAAAADVEAEAEAGSLASQDWREGSQEESAPVPCSQQTIHSQDCRSDRFRCSGGGGGGSCGSWSACVGRSCWS
jgi:hypothetical protein